MLLCAASVDTAENDDIGVRRAMDRETAKRPWRVGSDPQTPIGGKARMKDRRVPKLAAEEVSKEADPLWIGGRL